MGMPMYCHTDISDRVGSAVAVLPSSGVSMMPHSGERMSCQMKPTITTESNDPATNCELKTGVQNVSSRAPWTVLVLPYLEEQNRYDEFDFNKPFFGLSPDNGPTTSTPNDAAQKSRLEKYVCPSSARSGSSGAVAPIGAVIAR